RRHTRFSRDWSSDVCSSDLDDLVATLDRADEVGTLFIKLEQPVAISRQPEKIALLLHPLDGCALRTVAHAVVAQLDFVLVVIGFVAHRIPAGIAALVDVAIIRHRLPDRLGGAIMAFFGGADEI